MEKKGQFYLMAAIILSMLIAGFATLSNFSQRKDTVKIDDINQELRTESENVLDYGLNSGYTPGQINDLMQNFTDDYINYSGNEKDIYFVFGNLDVITVKGYSQSAKTIYVDEGNGETSFAISPGVAESMDFNPNGIFMNVTIDGISNDYVLKGGENFFFIISQAKGGETYVAKN